MSKRLKKSLSDFVDTLVDSEISQVGESVKEMKSVLMDEIGSIKKELAQFKESYKNDRKQLEALFADVHSNVHATSEHTNRIKHLEEKQQHVTNGIEDMIGKVATIVEDHHEQVEGQISDLSERVKHNEKILFVTRGDHEALTMILKKFSSGLSLINDEVQQPLDKENDEPTATAVTESAKGLVEKHHETVSLPVIEETSKSEEESVQEEIPSTQDETPPEAISGDLDKEDADKNLILDPQNNKEMENLDSMFLI